jgi:hypothetical protein
VAKVDMHRYAFLNKSKLRKAVDLDHGTGLQ